MLWICNLFFIVKLHLADWVFIRKLICFITLISINMIVPDNLYSYFSKFPQGRRVMWRHLGFCTKSLFRVLAVKDSWDSNLVVSWTTVHSGNINCHSKYNSNNTTGDNPYSCWHALARVAKDKSKIYINTIHQFLKALVIIFLTI